MAELDGWLSRARTEIVRLQDGRRHGLTEIQTVARLVPICADLLKFCSDFTADVLSRLPQK